MSDLEKRLATIRQQLKTTAADYQQPVPQLLAVSKKHPAADIDALYQAGQRAFGESYVQEATAKQASLAHLAIEWHFIGPIQANKTRDIANHFTWVHSVDRLKIARRLNDQRGGEAAANGDSANRTERPLNICVQVHIDNETNKAGVAPADTPALCEAIQAFPNLHLRGLMCIPRKQTEFTAQRQAFARLAGLFKDLNTRGFELDTLSMGMSNDFAAAIAEGTTLVRIGTALFGERD